MISRKHHCIGEYVIPCRTAISANAGHIKTWSNACPQGYAAAPSHMIRLPPWRFALIASCNLRRIAHKSLWKMGFWGREPFFKKVSSPQFPANPPPTSRFNKNLMAICPDCFQQSEANRTQKFMEKGAGGEEPFFKKGFLSHPSHSPQFHP